MKTKFTSASVKEKSITVSVRDLGLKGKVKYGDHYELVTDRGLRIPAYCNRANCSSLYTPDKQIPCGIVDRPKAGNRATGLKARPMYLNIVKICKVKS